MTGSTHALDLHVETLQERGASRWATQRDRDNATTARVLSDRSRPTISHVFSEYYRERQLPAKSKLEWERAKKALISCVGDVDVARVGKAGVRAFTSKLPSHLGASTRRKLLGAVGTVMAFAVRQGHLESNPVAGMAAPRGQNGSQNGDQNEKRLPFSDEDVRVILKATEAEQGAMYWLPRLAVYTGARAAELCGLNIADVRDGALYISPNDVRGVKTKASVRRVPLHSEVAGAFVAYCAAMVGPRCFPELKPGKYSVAAVYSKRFGRLLRSIGIKDARKVLHSARHTVKDKLRAARVPVEIQNAILGHSGGTVGESYGLGYPLHVLSEAVERISYTSESSQTS